MRLVNVKMPFVAARRPKNRKIGSPAQTIPAASMASAAAPLRAIRTAKAGRPPDGTDGQRREDRPQGNAHRPQHNVEREDHGECRQPQRQPERRAEHQRHDLPRLQLTPWPHPLLCELCKRRISDDLPDDLVHGANGRDRRFLRKPFFHLVVQHFAVKCQTLLQILPRQPGLPGAQLRKKFLLIHCHHPPL